MKKTRLAVVMRTPDYSEDIKVCENLITILRDQISRAKEGKALILPGSNVRESINHWERKIAEHKSTIAKLSSFSK